ncbi:MAG: DUF411 domain-containing protein [Pseudomonadota bacterium]
MRKFRPMLFITALLLFPLRAMADDAVRTGTLYKDPDCGCCEEYASYLRRNGYRLTVIPTQDLPHLRAARGIPDDLTGCHMALIDGYVIEGHVPAAMIGRLLSERPSIRGISLPGMPLGSPGMSGKKDGPFVVLEIAAETQNGEARVFAVE